MPLETNNHILLPNEEAWEVFRHEINGFLEPEADAGRASDLALDTLTAREMEVLSGVARGLGNRDLADLLRISEKTVRNHITTIFSKLGVESRAQAIVAARDAGLGRD